MVESEDRFTACFSQGPGGYSQNVDQFESSLEAQGLLLTSFSLLVEYISLCCRIEVPIVCFLGVKELSRLLEIPLCM
jgi:hypothetical protein